MERLVAAGLGLDYGAVALARTTEDWLRAGSDLRDRIAEIARPLAAVVEQIGSSSVLGLAAKPIVDLAVGLPADADLDALRNVLEREGWIYRGDAGDDRGHVFVLDARPWHRVAQLHAVEQGGPQWRNYLRLHDLLRDNSEARARDEAVKFRLAKEHCDDGKAYKDGKTQVVSELLAEGGRGDNRVSA